MYDISFPNAAHHEAEVTAVFGGLGTSPLEIRMSRTSPGRYALHEFAKNVYNVKAFDGKGRSLTVTQANPHQWNVAGHDGSVRVTYTVFGDRADGTYLGIDRSMAHLNIPATFVWARGLEARPISVTFRRPDSTWTVATQLIPTRDSSRFTAPHLQYFMDSPTHLGRHSWYDWPVASAGKTQTFRVALHHLGTVDEERRYVDATKKIVEAAGAVFSGYPEFDAGTYTFLAVYLPWAAGDGMEHRNSTSLTSTASLGQAMNGLLGTVSHEFFHAWNVERIRPRGLEPFDFTEANMSDALWLAEGFTNYYGPLILCRAGITDLDTFGETMAGAVNLVLNAPGRRFFSATQMSQQAPFTDAAVSIDPQNKANTFISYYPFGEAIGLALDLTLRQRGKTLDDLMRDLWKVHGAQKNFAPVRPYTLNDVRASLGRVSGDPAFARDFMARYVEGKEAAPYEALLREGGFVLRRAKSGNAWIGELSLRFDAGKATVLGSTLIGTPLYAAGVDRNDRIVSIDGKSVGSQADLDAVLAARTPGDAVPLVFESRGSTINATLTFAESPRIEIVTFEKAGEVVGAEVKAFREKWVGRK